MLEDNSCSGCHPNPDHAARMYKVLSSSAESDFTRVAGFPKQVDDISALSRSSAACVARNLAGLRIDYSGFPIRVAQKCREAWPSEI